MSIQPRYQAKKELIEAQLKDVCCVGDLNLRYRTDTIYCTIVPWYLLDGIEVIDELRLTWR
jgi:hypothetical protein